MTYEQLDTIADAYTPILGVLAIASIIWPSMQTRASLKTLSWRFAEIFILILLVYGLMYVDAMLHIWSSFGLDYSTHTALSLVLAMFLSVQHPKYWLPLAISLLAYFTLMRYQQYHTLSDIITTALAIAPLSLLALMLTRKHQLP
jgi:hypothetical protein